MEYTLEEVLEKLGIGRTTLNTKLKTYGNMLKNNGHMKKIGKRNFFNNEALEILGKQEGDLVESVRVSSEINTTDSQLLELKQEVVKLSNLLNVREIEIEHFRKENEYLRKDGERKDLILTNNQKMLEQQQIIFNTEQRKQLLLLEEKRKPLLDRLFSRKQIKKSE